jgi:ubiquinone/menaquinone biosynthesis C-methylase UbiE
MTRVEAYGQIASVYDRTPNALLALEQRTLLPLLPDLRVLLVIDIGAGTGRWLHHARSAGAQTLALDVSLEMLASAPEPHVLADALMLPLRDNSADIVFCTFTIGYAPQCFSELARVARPGGMLIVSDVHPDALARGWSRSFRVGDEVVKPTHYPYSIEDLHDPSMARTHLLEPRLGEPERPIFAAANKLVLYDTACAHPAIFVAIWTKRP